MVLWFISDLHFYHKNIIKLTNRPYSSIEEMHESFIKQWNEKVDSLDVVYLLGDVSFGSLNQTVNILERLNGEKHLIVGNHDTHFLKHPEFKECFYSVEKYKETKIEDMTICLSHYPMLNWYSQRKGGWMLHGHTHGTLKHDVTPTNRIMDVGVDTGQFLYSVADIKQHFSKFD